MEEILPHSPGDEPYGKSVQTRRAILLASAKLFSKEGYNATTMRRIAEAANLEAGSIYYHFGSKDRILDEVLDIGVRQLYEQIRGIVERSAAEGDTFRKTFAQTNHVFPVDSAATSIEQAGAR